ncbi:MAG: CoA-binding protein [candidate division Zixibacteria bacterium]|nr:CoA-binding protein [candidate division Zixibacteria bacterium]
MNNPVEEFFKSKGIAIVGASSRRMKFGNMAYRALKKKGYTVYAVNPNAETVNGDRCYPNVLLLPEEVQAAVVVIPPEKAFDLIEKVSEKGIKKLWCQQGADFSDFAEKARQRGLEVVTDRCILLYAEPVSGIHRVHRYFAKLFDKL